MIIVIISPKQVMPKAISRAKYAFNTPKINVINFHSKMRSNLDLHGFLANAQQQHRQKERFGEFKDATPNPQINDQQIQGICEIILRFVENPALNVDILLENRILIQYVPEKFVSSVSQTDFYKILGNFLNNNEFQHKILYIISAAITPISNFTMPLISSNLNGESIFQKINQILKFSLSPDSVCAAQECVLQIVKIRNDSMDVILRQWDIASVIVYPALRFMNDANLYRLTINTLIQILDNPNIKSYSIKSFAEKSIFLGNVSDDILSDSLLLLSKIIRTNVSHFPQATKTFAYDKLADTLMSFLTERSFNVKINTLNVIFQLSLGCPDPIDLLLSRNLLQTLINFAKENPNSTSEVLNVAYGITFYGPNYVEIICDSGIINLLSDVIISGSIDSQRAAVILASNIMCYGAFREISQVSNQQIISVMMEFLEDEYLDRLSEVILNGFIKGLDAEAEALSTTLRDAIKTQQFYEILQKYSSSNNQNLSTLSQILLNKLNEN